MSKLMWISIVCAGLSVAMNAQTPQPAPAEVELKEGDKAPEFTLPGTDGKAHKLADYKGTTVVLAWFPAAFSGG